LAQGIKSWSLELARFNQPPLFHHGMCMPAAGIYQHLFLTISSVKMDMPLGLLFVPLKMDITPGLTAISVQTNSLSFGSMMCRELKDHMERISIQASQRYQRFKNGDKKV